MFCFLVLLGVVCSLCLVECVVIRLGVFVFGAVFFFFVAWFSSSNVMLLSDVVRCGLCLFVCACLRCV